MALQDGCVAKQRREGRHATLEQPRYALIWNKTTLHYLPGYQCHLDKCLFELIITDENRMDQYTKKPTRLQCTDEGMAYELSLLCPGDHHHLPLEGSSPGVGNRAAASAVYQGVLCSCIVQEIINLIIYQEHGQTLMTHERIHAGDDNADETSLPPEPDFENLSEVWPDTPSPEQDQHAEVRERREVLQSLDDCDDDHKAAPLFGPSMQQEHPSLKRV